MTATLSMEEISSYIIKEQALDDVEMWKTRALMWEEMVIKHSAEIKYYQEELNKAHALLGRIVHQCSERWDTVRLTKYFPTDNLHNKRTVQNPEGK